MIRPRHNPHTDCFDSPYASVQSNPAREVSRVFSRLVARIGPSFFHGCNAVRRQAIAYLFFTWRVAELRRT